MKMAGAAARGKTGTRVGWQRKRIDREPLEHPGAEYPIRRCRDFRWLAQTDQQQACVGFAAFDQLIAREVVQSGSEELVQQSSAWALSASACDDHEGVLVRELVPEWRELMISG